MKNTSNTAINSSREERRYREGLDRRTCRAGWQSLTRVQLRPAETLRTGRKCEIAFTSRVDVAGGAAQPASPIIAAYPSATHINYNSAGKNQNVILPGGNLDPIRVRPCEPPFGDMGHLPSVTSKDVFVIRQVPLCVQMLRPLSLNREGALEDGAFASSHRSRKAPRTKNCIASRNPVAA
jgi:hypothetical protein